MATLTSENGLLNLGTSEYNLISSKWNVLHIGDGCLSIIFSFETLFHAYKMWKHRCSFNGNRVIKKNLHYQVPIGNRYII